MSNGKGYTPEQSKIIDLLATQARREIAAGAPRSEVLARLCRGFHGQAWVTVYNGIVANLG